MTLPNSGSAIYALLAGGTALVAELGGTKVYEDEAPRPGGTATPPPYVIYSRAGGGDSNSSPRRERSEVWLVKAVASDLQQARRIDGQIDARLHGGSLTVDGYGNPWLAREGDVAYSEPAGSGPVYWHRGGRYRIVLAQE